MCVNTCKNAEVDVFDHGMQGDGFDLYIDGARYLPDNVSLSIVSAYVASADLVMYGKLDKDVDPRSKSVWNPVYLARKEFRYVLLRCFQGHASLRHRKRRGSIRAKRTWKLG
jgi:hypothetical protein